MKGRMSGSVVVLASLVIFVSFGLAEQGFALDTAFTYQGRLEDGGSPANGTYDFQFYLFDAASLGTQIGSLNSKGDVAVTDGIFSVSLDFGQSAFDGGDRWLLVRVRPGSSTGSYTGLSPRRKVEPVPYSIFADTIYKKIVIVRPVGSDTENGTALLSALSGITDNAADNRYLVKIEPGTYELPSTGVSMKEYVDVQGSGKHLTTISSPGSFDDCTVEMADNCTLSDLKVENTGAGSYAYAVKINGVSPTLKDLLVTAEGGLYGGYGIQASSGNPTIENIEVEVVDTASYPAVGIKMSNGTMALKGSRIQVTGKLFTYGLHISAATMTIDDLDIEMSSESDIVGVYAASTSVCEFDDLNIAASGGDIMIRGFYLLGSSDSKVRNSYVKVSGGGISYGVDAYFEADVTLDNVNIDIENALSSAFGIYIYADDAVASNCTINLRSCANSRGANLIQGSFTGSNLNIAVEGGTGEQVACRNSASTMVLRNCNLEATADVSAAKGLENVRGTKTEVLYTRMYAESNSSCYGMKSDGSVSIRDSSMIAEGDTEYGAYLSTSVGTPTNHIDGCRIEGSTLLYVGSNCTLNVGATHFATSGSNTIAGTVNSVNCYDWNYNAYTP